MVAMPIRITIDRILVAPVHEILRPQPERGTRTFLASPEQSNVALERLAHATMIKGYSPASPLQALIG